MADEQHFRCLLTMGMRYDLWVGPEAVRLKQGMRKATVPLAEVTHFGVKRLPDDRVSLTELRLVTPSKVHKIPFNTGDEEARKALAALQALKPEADVSGLLWTEAAPLLGVKPFGLGALLMQPLAGAGIALVLLAPVAVVILNALFPPDAQERTYRPIALVIVMVLGVVLFFVGRRRFKASQAAEREAMARREGVGAGEDAGTS